MSGRRSVGFLENVPRPWKFLAPMVANSEEAYRDLARRYGADLCYTEMVNCRCFNNGRKNALANQWYTTSPSDRPLVIQICGNDPAVMLETCLAVQGACDAIDVNFGCPQDIARKGHYGSWLMDDPELVGRIVKTLSSQIAVPLFCKIRVFESIERTVEYARMIEANGCALLVVHGRQRHQKGPETGLASWEHIRAVKESLSIPVVANGNIIYHENIQQCIDSTGCDGVMVAEPHLFDPTILVPEKYRATDILREYLQIVRSDPRKAKFKHTKSHAFKMLQPALSANPELCADLDECKSLDQFLAFCDRVEKLVGEGELPADTLELRPYIRKSKL
ncbi:tRNA-dihydrouridine synthase 1 [Pancytospora philotis]|nr:tRNA-dihydrouridine synthase 1 [Pancytospora philotis]